MPNVLDAEPMRAFARRAAGKIADKKIRERYEKMVFDRLMADSRNFRPALQAEIDEAPSWARAAQDRRDVLCVFKLHRSASTRLHNVARRIELTSMLAAMALEKHPRAAAAINAAREFLEKFERASFEIAARKAYNFARVFESWSDDRDAQSVCADAFVRASMGRMWRRVTSVAELREVGREFRNCLARTAREGSYGGMLTRGIGQFWVLRDPNGVGLMVALAPAPAATHFLEVRGPRNARVSASHVDLMLLAAALGMPSDPPPPPPLAPLALDAVEELRLLCTARLRRAAVA